MVNAILWTISSEPNFFKLLWNDAHPYAQKLPDFKCINLLTNVNCKYFNYISEYIYDLF